MPVFQLLSCTLNPVNLLLFTLACSSYSLVSIYLSLTLSCSSTLPGSLLAPLSPSPCSTSPLLTHSPNSCVLPASLFMRIHLCRAAQARHRRHLRRSARRSSKFHVQLRADVIRSRLCSATLLSASAIASTHPPPPPVSQRRQVAQS